MPFYGQDWRSHGETWVRTQEGWERKKLRPMNSEDRNSSSQLFQLDESLRRVSESSNNGKLESPEKGIVLGMTTTTESDANSDSNDTDSEGFSQPHCFVKTNKSKEFVGCTSMSEAFHKLDLGRVFSDVQRFNYICKVVQILIRDKLQNLSGSARRILLSIVEVMVLHSLEQYTQVTTIRDMVEDFLRGLSEGHHIGSPSLLHSHQNSVSNFYDLLCDTPPATPFESNEDCVTLLDLPQECFRAILKRLPDHQSLLEASKAHEALSSLVDSEQRLWQSLCRFHFTDEQIKSIDRRRHAPIYDDSWRHRYFELKKFYGLREVYADMIHICCHCKALFWKQLGHPCIGEGRAPTVRVTPQQFVDMLMFL